MIVVAQDSLPGLVDALKAATAVTTPIGLVAFGGVLVLAAIYIIARNDNKQKKAAGRAAAVAVVNPDREKTYRLALILASCLCAIAMVPQVVALIPPKVPTPPVPTVSITKTENGGAIATITFNVLAVGAAPQLIVEFARDTAFKDIIAQRNLTGWQGGQVLEQLDAFPTAPVYVRLVALDRNGQSPSPGPYGTASIIKGSP